MACMAFNSEFVAVSCGTRVLVSQNQKDNLVAVEPQVVSKLITNDTDCGTKIESTQRIILGFDLSLCCRWIALCSSGKELSIWCCSNWTLKSSRLLQRSAEKVKFTPSGNDVIVADKSGDAYIFSVLNSSSEGKLLMGHLSMLLDILVSDDEKFIISCDRDEKIRVSHFPNAYNIQSYCLGHKEFVSSLSFLPHDKGVLLSGSGDGSLRFWNYINGNQIEMIDCSVVIRSYCHWNSMKTVASNRDETNSDEKCINNCAVMHVSCCNVNASSLTGICIEGFKGILIFRVNGNFEAIQHSLTEVIHLSEEPWDICFSFNGLLWYLLNGEKPLSSTCLDDKGKVLVCDKITTFGSFNIFNNYWKWLKNVCVPERKNTLYKRKYDNVLDYAEKKKARLIRDNETSH